MMPTLWGRLCSLEGTCVPTLTVAFAAMVAQCATAQSVSSRYTLRGHSNEVGEVAFSPDGRTLASGSSEYEAMDGTSGEVKLWDALTGRLKHTLNDRGYTVTGLAFSPDGRTLASGNFNNDDADEEVCLWNVQTGHLKRRLSGAGPVAFSPNGKLLATGGETSELKGGADYVSIRLCDAYTGRLFRVLTPSGLLDSLAFSPDGKTLVSGSNRRGERTTAGSVQLWNVPAGRLRRTLVNAGASSVTCSPDGHLRADISGDRDQMDAFRVTIYDAKSGHIRHTLRHRQNVYGFAFSPDSKTLITGSGGGVDHNRPESGRVDLWDLTTGRLKAERRLHSPVLSVAVSPNGRLLATGLGDNTVRLWRIAGK